MYYPIIPAHLYYAGQFVEMKKSHESIQDFNTDSREDDIKAFQSEPTNF
jgi:hypothetical protein